MYILQVTFKFNEAEKRERVACRLKNCIWLLQGELNCIQLNHRGRTLPSKSAKGGIWVGGIHRGVAHTGGDDVYLILSLILQLYIIDRRFAVGRREARAQGWTIPPDMRSIWYNTY
jgi:hypothetical protein